jgi:surfeit locus 1 family protein
MVALGVWQLGRADEKAALLAQYEAASGVAVEAVFPISGDGADVWFRRSSLECVEVVSIDAVAGRSDRGQKGWAQRAICKSGSDAALMVDLGYSRDLAGPEWDGGEVTGIIAPGPRLVAAPAVAGLQMLAAPDPKDLPNNHLAYAGQWFFFALTALVIYILAVGARAKRRT